MYILGISAHYHDSAACLIKDGEILFAAQEERFSRIKHDSNFPKAAIKFCLKEANIKPDLIDSVVFYEKPILKFDRLIETYFSYAPLGFKSFRKSIPLWVTKKLFQKNSISKDLTEVLGNDVDWRNRILFSEHHLSHAASAFFPSPFEKAAVLTFDAVGEWATTSLALGDRNSLKIIKEIKFPHSLGLLYSSFTYYLGFKVNSGEYKVMGLAPYGKPKYKKLIEDNLINLAEDGSFKLDMSFFNYAVGLTMTNKKFENLFGGPPRKPESDLTQKHMDIAASIQKVIEEIIVKIAKSIREETKEKNLCLAGGVALNCVANSVLEEQKIFENIWVQPAAGDAGGSIGAALSVWYLHHNNDRKIDSNNDGMKSAFLGPSYDEGQIEQVLKECKATFSKVSDDEVLKITSEELKKGKAIGWMQGRMEFGPRALGGRSILADPRSRFMQKQLNLKVKNRESFRPFAPSILEDDVSDWFENDKKSPYMLFISKIRKNKRIKTTEEEDKLTGLQKLNINRSEVPAITHVDFTARVQTVSKKDNPKYYALIEKFKEITGCPMIVNTSFNIRGEPIVCTPYDAFMCFMGTELDLLIIENFILYKEEQKALNSKENEKFTLD